MKIGVISDTHNFLDPKVAKLFAGVDHILHAGDIGLPWVIMELEGIAPVTAVLGNTDDGRLEFKATELVELAGRKFLLHHIVDPRAPVTSLSASDGARGIRGTDAITGRPPLPQPDVVVFG